MAIYNLFIQHFIRTGIITTLLFSSVTMLYSEAHTP